MYSYVLLYQLGAVIPNWLSYLVAVYLTVSHARCRRHKCWRVDLTGAKHEVHVEVVPHIL